MTGPPGRRLSDQLPWVARVPFFYGWVILAVSCLAMFTSSPGQTFAVSIFVDPIIEDRGWSRTLVASMYTFGSLTAAGVMLLVGRLQDRYGARVMLTGVALLFGLAALGMSLVDSPVLLYLGFAGIRILGQGSLGLISTTLVALWFVRKRGMASAVTALGIVAGQAAFPPLIHLLISQFDWRQAWVVLAFVIWGLLLLPAAVLVRRSPEAVGLLPDGDSARQSRVSSGLRAHTPGDVDWSLAEALRTRAFWLLLLGASAPSFISTALIFHHVSFLSHRGIDPGVAAAVLSVMAPAALLGTLSAGFLADAIPNRYIVAVNQVILALTMAWSFLISEPWQAFLYGGMLGLSGGSNMTINYVIWANYYGRRNLGSIRGVVLVGTVAFTAAGPLPFGILFDLTDSYNTAVLVFLAMPVVSGTAAFLARPPLRRDQGEVRGS